MRATFQILAIPYRIIDGLPFYCVFHRADFNQWQFIAGGGENHEAPLESAKREAFEEAINKLNWDSNRTALYELNCRLEVK